MASDELLTRLRARVGAGSSATTNADLTEDLGTAQLLVNRYVEDFALDPGSPPPGDILNRAIVQVAADLFNRRRAQNGVIVESFTTADGQTGGTPIRLGRDPIASARDLLAPWVLEVAFG